ncbi:MAG: hypothetical protein RLZZ09_2415, partial [Pseudomonadota bacterium]
MTQPRITEALGNLFASHAVVFWHDPDGEYVSSFADLAPEGITLLQMDALPALGIKIQLERAGRDDRFLLYSAKPEPDPAHDWLLDVRLRSKPFRADQASIFLEDLGLASQQLREHLKSRAQFLGDSDRVERLKRLVLPHDTAADVDRKMIAVLVKAEPADLSAILLRLYAGLVADGVASLDAVPPAWSKVI